MSTNVTFNGTTYAIPAAGELNWQALSAFLLDVGQHAGLNTTDKQTIRVALTTPVTVSASADYAVVTKLSAPAAVAVTLPAGVDGQVFVVADGTGDANTNNVTITPNGSETINGAANYVMNKNNQMVVLQFSTTLSGWTLVGGFYPALTSALTNPMTTSGDIIYGGASGVPTRLATGAASTVLIAGTPPTYALIANANVSASAAIAYSKLNLATSIVNADIATAAAIAGSKITPAFVAQNISTTGTLAAGVTTITGKMSASGSSVIGSTTVPSSAWSTVIGVTDAGAAGLVLAQTSGSPSRFTLGTAASGLSFYDEIVGAYRANCGLTGDWIFGGPQTSAQASTKVTILSTSEICLDLLRTETSGGLTVQAFHSNSGAQLCGTITMDASAHTVAYNTSSDERLKTNFKSFAGLDFIGRLSIYEYERISKPGFKEHGVKAQEAYKVYPEAVQQGGDDADQEPWLVDYSRFVAPVIQSIQELLTLIKDQTEHVKGLEARVQILERT